MIKEWRIFRKSRNNYKPKNHPNSMICQSEAKWKVKISKRNMPNP